MGWGGAVTRSARTCLYTLPTETAVKMMVTMKMTVRRNTAEPKRITAWIGRVGACGQVGPCWYV